MNKNPEKFSQIDTCPIRNVVARFGNKWSLLVLQTIDENETIRFNGLCKTIPDISTKVLSNTLHLLEADGLVKRTVFPEVPLRVEYELTPVGRSLIPIVRTLADWALTHMDTILSHRKKYGVR